MDLFRTGQCSWATWMRVPRPHVPAPGLPGPGSSRRRSRLCFGNPSGTGPEETNQGPQSDLSVDELSQDRGEHPRGVTQMPQKLNTLLGFLKNPFEICVSGKHLAVKEQRPGAPCCSVRPRLALLGEALTGQESLWGRQETPRLPTAVGTKGDRPCVSGLGRGRDRSSCPQVYERLCFPGHHRSPVSPTGQGHGRPGLPSSAVLSPGGAPPWWPGDGSVGRSGNQRAPPGPSPCSRSLHSSPGVRHPSPLGLIREDLGNPTSRPVS